MTVEIQRPSSIDVSSNNPNDIVYIKGNETTDGSIRFIFTAGDNEASIELRTSGVWNDTGLRFASSSVSLGRDLRIGAVGGFVETLNISEIDDHIKALLPHIQFDLTGTTEPAHMPILDKRETFVIFGGPAFSEVSGTVLGQVFSAIPTRILHSVTHTIGSVAATADIQASYYKGTDNTGPLLSRFNLPPSAFPANTPITITYEDDFGFENAQDIFLEYTSPNTISLVTNASGEILMDQDGHDLDELDILMDELVLTNDLSLTFDNNLGFITNNRFAA